MKSSVWNARQLTRDVIKEAIDSRIAYLCCTPSGNRNVDQARALYDSRDQLSEAVLDRLVRDFTIVRRRRGQKTVA